MNHWSIEIFYIGLYTSRNIIVVAANFNIAVAAKIYYIYYMYIQCMAN